MLTHPMLDQMHALGLAGMAAAYRQLGEQSHGSDLSFDERLGLMLDREIARRTDKRLTNRPATAKLRFANASIEDIDFSTHRGLDSLNVLSLARGVVRAGFDRMVAEVCLGKVGAVAAREVSRFARNSRDWQQLIEMCRVVDTVLIDQETVYAPRQGNDRLLLGLKGSLNEYELDLLRQRSLSARYEKARRGELVVAAPVGFMKVGDRLEKEPDRRVQESIALVFDKVAELGTPVRP
ncbi:recombinase family protein [Mesorhizobium sp. M0578]|uniref:recombinase family protein n=1 Tax=unclassified Mesorhizobium TaxID=325217 RepID=UPI00333628B8